MQGVVQCHIRCTVLGDGEDQSLGGDAAGFRRGYPGGSGEVAYQGDSGCCFR